MKRAHAQVLLLVLLTMLASRGTLAQDRRLHISAVPDLVETGFLKHLLPRFSLKNNIPITIVPPEERADARFGTDGGTPVFASGDTVWTLLVEAPAAENPHLQKFRDWLASESGQRAVEGFAGPPEFRVALAAAAPAAQETLPGNIARGAELSVRHCGRCHVVGPQNRMAGLGSTPSFAALRTIDNWRDRFAAFYALKPHPSFTQVLGVSLPFRDGTDPVITPLQLTLDDLEDITAYAASIAPADLGPPLRHQ